MKTLSETILEGGTSDISPVEGGKKGGKEELGALTANTFGFQEEALKNEEKPNVRIGQIELFQIFVCI